MISVSAHSGTKRGACKQAFGFPLPAVVIIPNLLAAQVLHLSSRCREYQPCKACKASGLLIWKGRTDGLTEAVVIILNWASGPRSCL